MKRPFSLALGVFIIFTSVSSIFAWGGDGHQLSAKSLPAMSGTPATTKQTTVKSSANNSPRRIPFGETADAIYA